MPVFEQRPQRRDRILSIRLSEQEEQVLDELMERLGLGNKVDVIRIAIDNYLETLDVAGQLGHDDDTPARRRRRATTKKGKGG